MDESKDLNVIITIFMRGPSAAARSQPLGTNSHGGLDDGFAIVSPVLIRAGTKVAKWGRL